VQQEDRKRSSEAEKKFILVRKIYIQYVLEVGIDRGASKGGGEIAGKTEIKGNMQTVIVRARLLLKIFHLYAPRKWCYNSPVFHRSE
jgi:hypothetical protein